MKQLYRKVNIDMMQKVGKAVRKKVSIVLADHITHYTTGSVGDAIGEIWNYIEEQIEDAVDPL